VPPPVHEPFNGFETSFFQDTGSGGKVVRPAGLWYTFTGSREEARVDNRVAFITGASAGIGEALGLELARRGFRVSLAARRVNRLERLAERIRDDGGEALPLGCDVTSDASVQSAVAETRARFGRIDYVIANAGFGVAGRFDGLTLDDYRNQFETNVFGVLRTIAAAREDLIASRGCLGIVGSVNSFVSMPGSSPYCMSKHALHALAVALRHELRASGVGVVLIAPGFVDSEIRKVDNRGIVHEEAVDPVPRWLRMRADRAARAIAHALERRSRTAVITGHGKLIVLLARHAPWLVDAAIRGFGIRARREAASGGASRA
jgi:short-subunit dehydrogenase